MCIRDSGSATPKGMNDGEDRPPLEATLTREETLQEHLLDCLLYTSDAADERSSVDLGGRRIIKKKKHIYIYYPLDGYVATIYLSICSS